jgi:hypothetical protein
LMELKGPRGMGTYAMKHRARFLLFFTLFIACFCLSQSAAQSLRYSTYLPISLTAQNITIYGMAVDSAGESCIVGIGTAPNDSFFVSKLGSDGITIYSVSNLNGATLNGAGPAAMDNSGNCYVFGYFGAIVPSAGAFQSSPPNGQTAPWIAKFDGSGNTVFATYVGGSGPDTVGGIAVDNSGNVYLTGNTQSSDFPSKNPYQATLSSESAPDAFITVLNSSGTALIYSTYWGGTGPDIGYSIAVDSSKNAYIAGGTCSTDFPTVSPFQSTLAGCANAFVIKLDPTGTPIYATYLGGATGSTNALKVATDGAGAAYVAGSAESGFPLMNPIQSTADGSVIFLSKLNPTGSALVYSTYLGNASGGALTPVGLAADSGGRAYVVGNVGMNQSISLVSPIQNSVGSGAGASQFSTDGFVSVVESTGTALSFSTYLGGSYDVPAGAGVDSSGNVYVSGRSSAAFPLLNSPISVYFPRANLSGSVPAATQPFLLKISPSAGTSLSFVPAVDVRTNPQPVGSSSDPFALLVANTNSTGDTTIRNIAISGDFSQTNNCPQTLQAATSCYVQVTFTPTAVGWRDGTITITDSAPGSPHVISLIGAGVPQVSLSPPSLAFSTQLIGTSSAAHGITLSNSGSGPLAIASISVSGDFSETNTCRSPVPGSSSCSISIVFTPTTAGSRDGILTIVDSASGSPLTASLTGAGAKPSLGLGLASGGSDAATVPAGTTATYMLALGGGGISGTATLTCTGAPQGVTCTVPASETVNAMTPSNFTASVSTTSRTTSQLWMGPAGWIWAMAILGGVLLPAPQRGRSPRNYLALLALVLVPVFLLSSCGGSSKTNPDGTPAGTYTLTITAKAGSNSQSMGLMLKVQ